MKALICFLLESWLLVGVIVLVATGVLVFLAGAGRAKANTELWGPEAYLFDHHPDTRAAVLSRHPDLRRAIDDYRHGKPWSVPSAGDTAMAVTGDPRQENPEPTIEVGGA